MTAHYSQLTPDIILAAIDQQGFLTNGQILALNSYENRVYRVGLENDAPIVCKFYRPQRWSAAAIQEEHQFSEEMIDVELPIVTPLKNQVAETVHQYKGFLFSLYPMQAGRWPDLDNLDDYYQLGRLVARMHLVGQAKAFEHRPSVSISRMGNDAIEYLLQHDFIPADLKPAYETLMTDLLTVISSRFDDAGAYQSIRLHGDCHRGNILWTDEGPWFVDLDDAINGPAIQDLWMMLAGDRQEQTLQLSELLEGYQEFRDFNKRELHLIEALRTLRMIYYSAWLARRWTDSAFPIAFPWFNTQHYWEGHILELKEQLSNLQEPILIV